MHGPAFPLSFLTLSTYVSTYVFVLALKCCIDCLYIHLLLYIALYSQLHDKADSNEEKTRIYSSLGNGKTDILINKCLEFATGVRGVLCESVWRGYCYCEGVLLCEGA